MKPDSEINLNRGGFRADFEFLAAALQDGYIFLRPEARSRFREQAIGQYGSRLEAVESPRQFWMLLSDWLASLAQHRVAGIYFGRGTPVRYGV